MGLQGASTFGRLYAGFATASDLRPHLPANGRPCFGLHRHFLPRILFFIGHDKERLYASLRAKWHIREIEGILTASASVRNWANAQSRNKFRTMLLRLGVSQLLDAQSLGYTQ